MKSDLEARMLRGANWFFWIAAFSIVEAALAGRHVAVISSLGLGVVRHPQTIGQSPSYGLDAVAIVACILFGFIARRALAWAFILGMLAYAADGVIFFVQRDYLGVAIHLLMLLGLWSGLAAANMLKENAQLTRDLAIRASLQKDREARAAAGVPAPETAGEAGRPKSTAPGTATVEAPQAWRPGAPPSE